ncbi:MAG: PD-(D/E)XK nuclease family protein, partial [Solirubrobacteraceae bacterium]
YSTLASPLAGCSRDALALLAGVRRDHGDLWGAALALAPGNAAGLAGPDHERLRRFCGWFEAELVQSRRLGISQLLERGIANGRYIEHVRALDWAERRVANVHKLLRLARAFEAQEGRDLRGFVDHVEHLKRAAVKEPEAPVESVEPDTVQLMTVHTAKGLEFPVVCVADLGRRRPSPADGLFVDGERIGLRLARPGEGETVKTLEYEQLRAERRAREREEEDRVFYVAMTRARERLLLSGVVNFASWPKENDTSPPLSWLGPALIPDVAELVQQGPGVRTVVAGGGEGPPVRLTVSDPAGYGTVLQEPPAAPLRSDAAAAPELPAQREPQVAASAPDGAGGTPQAGGPALALAPQPAVLAAPPTISYTSLSLLERCGYRYYLERVLRMPEERLPAADAPEGAGLEARARGTLVHLLMERSDLVAATGPSEQQVAAAAEELRLQTRAKDRAEVAALIAEASRAPLAARLARAGRHRPEHPFAFSLAPGEPLVTGVIDLLCEEPDGTALVVDYKSDRIAAGANVEQLVEREYAVQRLLYALAVLREGALVVEVVHWFLERPHEPAVARCTAAERAALEEQLAQRLAAAWTEPFAVSARPHLGLCLTCPGRGTMCSWDREMTDRELSRDTR